ncbi:MAG: RNA polymerase sigma factor [Reichenbachiella sp.]
MDNPFQLDYTDTKDASLVLLSINGDKKALQSLILRHQIFVYNLALKMTKSVQDAEDLTQEVFIKAITGLSKFEGKSAFRTWLYRITVNHFLNSKKKASEMEFSDFETYFKTIDITPSIDLEGEEENELEDTIEELRISCTTGMLMCLERKQRMIFILGEMFDIDHSLGSEIMNISKGNFRIQLMRARKDLYNWMNKKCGLINTSNPCKCSKKTKSYIELGVVNPENLKFNVGFQHKIQDLSKNKALEITHTIEDLNKTIFQQHPLQESLSSKKIIDQIINNELIKVILNI